VLGLQQADDEVIFDAAARDGRVIVSADTDFGMILARRRTALPSVILFRHGAERIPERQVNLIVNSFTQSSRR
jgi:predicted nuclease of predicted toxin-antitoxin system